jgi:hypothetical protein
VTDEEAGLANTKHMAACVVCSKRSDAAKKPLVGYKVTACGTCYDAWKKSPEHKNVAARTEAQRFMDFLERRQAEDRNGTTRSGFMVHGAVEPVVVRP